MSAFVRLVEFETTGGGQIYLNPEHVTAVVPVECDKTSKVFTSDTRGEEYWSINMTARAVVVALRGGDA